MPLEVYRQPAAMPAAGRDDVIAAGDVMKFEFWGARRRYYGKDRECGTQALPSSGS